MSLDEEMHHEVERLEKEILYIDDESDKLPQAEGLGMQTQLYERKNTVQTLRSFI